ncbi:MAG: hypothetical protein IPL26_10815 [Leptospiraceae bacterium]|nr:hypothetical protein [Leptospiraceae bacterium]
MNKFFHPLILLFFFFIPLLSISSDCKIEQDKFCKEISNPKAKVIQCLAEHKDDLSDVCKSHLKTYSEKMQQNMKVGCKADVDSFCKWVLPGGGRILKCLFKNETSLSDSCKKVLNE